MKGYLGYLGAKEYHRNHIMHWTSYKRFLRGWMTKMAASEQGWKTDCSQPGCDGGLYWGQGMEHAHRENTQMETGGWPIVMTTGS